jgi:hypothetical protein
MALTRAERFRLKSAMLAETGREESSWDLRQLNLLLGEFGLVTLDGDWNGPSFEDVIAKLSDTDLVEMYSLVTGETAEQVQDAIEAADDGANWKAGYVRLFISHSAVHRDFVGKVSDELAVVGIDGFVAHNTMEKGKPWQTQIEHALRTMDAFVALVHPEVNDSAWCHQEIGWALGRRVPKYAIRMGANPAGFLGSDQWPSAMMSSHKDVAADIRNWLSMTLGLGDKIVNGLLRALEDANNYVDAGAASERLASLGDLTPENWERLKKVFWGNDQLYGGVLARRQLKPFYEGNGQEWPPEKPPEPKTPIINNDPWAVPQSTGTDEPPS